MNITLIISVIGCVTGLVSLSVTIWRLYSERYNLQIQCRKNISAIIPNVESLNYFDSKFHCIMYLDIINRSNSPISIYSVEAFYKGKNLLIDICEQNELRSIISGDKIRIFPMKHQIYGPIRLQPHDVYSGSLFLPSFPDYSCEEKILLKFRTTRRTKKVKLFVKSVKDT